MKTVFIFCVMLVFGCSQKENATLKKAAAIQIESFSALDSIERTIQSLTNIPALTDSIKKIESEVAQWETEMIDIPGYESTHLEHNHSHSQKIEELTPEQMLSVQQELKQQLTHIHIRLKKLQTDYAKSF
jgi:predicted transcriptional regulator